MSGAVKVLVYTRQALVREGLRRILPAGHEVIEAGDSESTLMETASRLHPEVLILDSVLTGEAVDSLTRELALVAPTAKLILLNGTHERPRAANSPLFRIDASHADREILAALGAPGDRPVLLTERQAQILRALAEGKANKEIAAELGVSVKTVEFHRARISQKVGVKSIAQLARFAAGQGLV